MAFFLYSQYQASQQQAAMPNELPPGIDISIPDFSNDGPRADATTTPGSDPRANPFERNSETGGEWSVDTSIPSSVAEGQQESVTIHRIDSAHQDVVRSGDWELQEGVSTPNANGGGNTTQPSASKKTREGDWSIEEVEKN